MSDCAEGRPGDSIQSILFSSIVVQNHTYIHLANSSLDLTRTQRGSMEHFS